MPMTGSARLKKLRRESKWIYSRFYKAKRLERPGGEKPAFKLAGVVNVPVIEKKVEEVKEEKKEEKKEEEVIKPIQIVPNPFARKPDSEIFKKIEPAKETGETKAPAIINIFAKPKPEEVTKQPETKSIFFKPNPQPETVSAPAPEPPKQESKNIFTNMEAPKTNIFA